MKRSEAAHKLAYKRQAERNCGFVGISNGVNRAHCAIKCNSVTMRSIGISDMLVTVWLNKQLTREQQWAAQSWVGELALWASA